MYLADVGDLNDRVGFRDGELAPLREALDIEREDANWCNLGLLTFTLLVELHVLVIVHVDFQLIGSLLVRARSNCVGPSFNVNPAHSDHFVVNHEPE